MTQSVVAPTVNPVVQYFRDHSERLTELVQDSEELGRLSDETVAMLRESGVMRMLQPIQHGGDEAHPVDFIDAVMTASRANPSAGWVAGVVGVHPWELGMADARLREELWGEDPDVWIASPYAPSGLATPVEGGYRVTGHWQFSSGTDHSQWVVLGALLTGRDGAPTSPPVQLHVVLPRPDYTIDQDSWDVVGLKGTGSKDILIEDAFVPDYRVLDADTVMAGDLARKEGLTNPLYHIPFWSMFPAGITASTIGICQGLLDTHLEYQKDRVMAIGTPAKEDPYILHAVAEAASEIAASRAHLVENIRTLYDALAAGEEITWEQRAQTRRDQIRAAWRAVSAADEIFARSGGNALRMNHPMQRYWRDAHAGLNHAIHITGTIYHASTLSQIGAEPAPHLRALI